MLLLEADAQCRRLTELTMQFWQHGPDAEALTRLGWTQVDTFGGQLSITGPSGIRTAFYLGLDPIAIAVSLAMGHVGMLWPSAVPGLLKAVDLAWKASRAEARDAQPAVPEAISEPVVMPGQLALFKEA